MGFNLWQIIGVILAVGGVVTNAELKETLKQKESSGKPMEHPLIKLRFATEKDDVAALAVKFGFPFVELSGREIPPEVIRMVSAKFAAKRKVIPVGFDGTTLIVAISDPNDMRAIDDLRAIVNVDVRVAVATEENVTSAVDKYYGQEVETVEAVLRDMEEDEALPLKAEAELIDNDLSKLESMANEAPVVRLVNLIISEAVRRQASDIHIEPFENELKVRYRIDGILYETPPPPKRLCPAIISRIKIMANMNIAEKRLPQDGRTKTKTLDREVDIRVSTAPILHGESMVLRLLDRSSLLLSLEQLGFLPKTLENFNSLITKPHGIILVTGPTGSGKTTTLYAALQKINSPEKKIITIEDPVEYELPGVNQMEVRQRIGFTFANGLRTIVRQDPDIILVGEIRDLETAEIAIQAALTGHLVFSTLHTNDAASAVTRLLDMGVEEFLVASTVRGILAQRLVRVLCPFCKEPYIGAEGKGTFYRAKGCDKCDGIGYRGRTGIYELLLVSDEIEKLVLERTSSTKIRERALEEGMMTLYEDGLKKVSAGVTTVEEVFRVTQE